MPNQELNVPLWLAIELRNRNQCQIKVPPWMTLQNLTAVIKAERTDMSTFQPLPFRYVEVRDANAFGRPLFYVPATATNMIHPCQVAKLLLTHAKEDIGSNYFKLRDLITSIQCLRMNKIIQGIQEVQGPVTITLRNLSAFECNQVRHIFLYGMDNFHDLSSVMKDVEPALADAGPIESFAPL